ncbi:MAG: hypothetical protein ABNH29_16800 [Paracoccus sp. (in: a-proteobacteria)]|uniref:hypothetical protein n=1 Tax=Paracoccus sp. TaxID=267 RepID=UPI0032D97796
MPRQYDRHISADAMDDEPIGAMRVLAAVIILSMAAAVIGLALMAPWVSAWMDNTRPAACDAYRGAEVAACINELAR